MRKNQELRVVENFMRQVEFDESGHWIWTGSLITPNPKQQTITYGRYHHTLNGEPIQEQAHRFIYQVIKRSLVGGEKLLNTCENTLCVNPEHWRTLKDDEPQGNKCPERHQVSDKANKIVKDEFGKVMYLCSECNALLAIRQIKVGW
jgi:hypothetical protein